MKSIVSCLTPREKEVVLLVIQGISNKVIAEMLNIACRTAEAHRARVYAKLGIRNAVELTNLVRDHHERRTAQMRNSTPRATLKLLQTRMVGTGRWGDEVQDAALESEEGATDRRSRRGKAKRPQIGNRLAFFTEALGRHKRG